MKFFRPKLLDTFEGYNSTLFSKDVLAGIAVGVVALPLAMAFAIASGLKPEAGIFTAIIAGGAYLGLRRQSCANWWSSWRVHRHCVRYC